MSNFQNLARVVASIIVLAVSVPVPARADQQEAKMGDQVYKWLAGHGKIVTQSPLYDLLSPIATPLKTVADPRYDAPFIFTLGRDPYPNVASVPGGRVYVSEKTFDVIRYREELAGALCHAVAHTVRHDYAGLVRKNVNAQLSGIALISLLMSGSPPLGMFIGDFSKLYGQLGAGGALTTAASLAAAASAESGADLMGADLCAQAGLNPWGLVWLLQNYRKSAMAGRMEMLSDAPGDRIRNLEAHFASAPERFAGFERDRANGTPLRP